MKKWNTALSLSLSLLILLASLACSVATPAENATVPPIPQIPQTPANVDNTTAVPAVIDINPINYARPAKYEYTGTITYDQLRWTYLIHIPSTYDETRPTPLVLVLHGSTMDTAQIASITGFNSLADKENFIVVYPKSYGDLWNTRTKAFQLQDVDEVGFISALIDTLEKEFNIDRKMVYITGFSAGARMCYLLAGQLSDKVAAAAPVSGTLYQDSPTPVSSRPLSMLIINGTEDPMVPWKGSNTSQVTFPVPVVKSVDMLSIPDTVKFWVDYNHCSAPPVVSQLPDSATGDGTRVRIEKYGGCASGAEVILYAIEGGGHAWPSVKKYPWYDSLGNMCRDFNASEAIWQFFKEHPRQEAE
jgi:polyhydroxybutyrate depolymerase